MTRKPNHPGPAKDSAQELAEAATIAESQLRRAAVRITPARVKVLATLLRAPRALTHQDVQDSLTEMDRVALDRVALDRVALDRVALDRVTLYRALDCLTEAGLAHKIAGDDRVFRYSAGTESVATATTSDPHTLNHQHGHFKCTRCAKVFCLNSIGETGLLRSALEESLGKGFQSHDIEFTLKGWCADCAR